MQLIKKVLIIIISILIINLVNQLLWDYRFEDIYSNEIYSKIKTKECMEYIINGISINNNKEIMTIANITDQTSESIPKVNEVYNISNSKLNILTNRKIIVIVRTVIIICITFTLVIYIKWKKQKAGKM